jgi:hypothetical protein
MTCNETGYRDDYDGLDAQEENDAELAAIFPEMTDAELDTMFLACAPNDWDDVAWESRRESQRELADLDYDARRAA